MTQWNEAPTRLPELSKNASPEEVAAYVRNLADMAVKIAKDLEHILNGNVDFNNIRANSITTDLLQAGAVVADKIDVDQLSAISADMGTIEAGEVYGARIATTHAGVYPRCEMSSTGNLFGVYLDADNFLELLPVDAGTGAPTMSWVATGSQAAQLFADASSITLRSVARELNFETQVQGNVNMIPASGYSVFLPSTFATLFSDTGQSLASLLQSLSDRITALGG